MRKLYAIGLFLMNKYYSMSNTSDILHHLQTVQLCSQRPFVECIVVQVRLILRTAWNFCCKRGERGEIESGEVSNKDRTNPGRSLRNSETTSLLHLNK